MAKAIGKPLTFLFLVSCLFAACGNPIFRDALLKDEDALLKPGEEQKVLIIEKIEYKYWASDSGTMPTLAAMPWNHTEWTRLETAAAQMTSVIQYLYYICRTFYVDGTSPLDEIGLETVYGMGGRDLQTIEKLYRVEKYSILPQINSALWTSGGWKKLETALGELNAEKPCLWYASKTTYLDGNVAYTLGLQAVYGLSNSATNSQETSVIWKGEAASPAVAYTKWGAPVKNWAYYNTDDKKIYIYYDNNWQVVNGGTAP